MRKFLFIVIAVFVLIPISLFSGNLNIDIGLSDLQMREFSQKKLSFDFQSGSSGFMNFSTGIIAVNNYKHWVAYEGFSKLSEAEFFRITGYDREAKEVKKHNATRISLVIGGSLASILGVYLFASSLEGAPRQITGAVILSSGLASLVTGAYMLTSNRYPSNIAVTIAEDYNSKLKSEILNSY